MYDTSNLTYEQCAPRILDALVRYGKDHRPVGGFLQALVANDLSRAIASADVDNRATLRELVVFVHNELPFQCHGSPRAYENWIKDACENDGGCGETPCVCP